MKAPSIGLIGSIVGEILASHLHPSPDGRRPPRGGALLAQVQAAVQAGRSQVTERLREHLQLPSADEVEALHVQVKTLEEEIATLREQLPARREQPVHDHPRTRRKKNATSSEEGASATGTGSTRRARTRGKGNRT
ncbi:MAG TPA: hypothetical protein VF265_03880 [Nevskiaceae bacterium]